MRSLSMQAAAVRKRKEREKKRASSVIATPNVTSAPLLTSVPPAPPAASPAVPAAATSPSSSASSAPRFTLLQTEVVTGPGVDAFSGPTSLGGDEQGNGATPIVDAAPAPQPSVTSQREAAMIGHAIRMYCGFGWGALLEDNEEALARMVPNEQMRAAMLNGGLDTVEASATALALKYNVRIPWGDELTVGLGVGVASLGVAKKFKKPANDNRKKRASAAAASSSSSSAPASPDPYEQEADTDEADRDDGAIDMPPGQVATESDGDQEVTLG